MHWPDIPNAAGSWSWPHASQRTGDPFRYKNYSRAETRRDAREIRRRRVFLLQKIDESPRN